jgi:hypothetical protein
MSQAPGTPLLTFTYFPKISLNQLHIANIYYDILLLRLKLYGPCHQTVRTYGGVQCAAVRTHSREIRLAPHANEPDRRAA